MNNYQLISDYKHHEVYKNSFNQLAKLVFELDFSMWYEQGCWNDRYICYSYVDGDVVIANASISKMTLLMNGVTYNAIQIGTVMTHPDYRGQGLAGKLMDHILQKYEASSDFIYLFANQSVIDFYPKYGFTALQESSYTLEKSAIDGVLTAYSYRRVNPNDSDDFQLLQQFAKERIAISSTMGVLDNEALLMFYFLIACNEAIYYIEELEVIVLFEQEEDELHIFDIVSKRAVDYQPIIQTIATAHIRTIHFHFIPNMNLEHVKTIPIIDSDDILFMRPLCENMPQQLLMPLTSHS